MFSRVCSCALAVFRVNIIFPDIIVIGAVKCVRNATLLKCPDDCIMGNSVNVERKKGVKRGTREHMQRGTLEVLSENDHAGDSSQQRRGEAECGRRRTREDQMVTQEITAKGSEKWKWEKGHKREHMGHACSGAEEGRKSVYKLTTEDSGVRAAGTKGRVTSSASAISKGRSREDASWDLIHCHCLPSRK